MRSLIIVIGLVAAGGSTIFAVAWLGNRYLVNGVGDGGGVNCDKKGASHLVVIQHDAASPEHTHALRCDTLTIRNDDAEVRLMAFGPHDNHQPYDGVAEQELAQGQRLTVTLNQAGTYHFHDHLGDVAQGDFTVQK